MANGKVMMLQGASSAGKSTLAKRLQVHLDEYWWALEADDITRMQPTWQLASFWEPAADAKRHPSWDPVLRLERWLAGYWQCLAAIARTGSNVIAVGGWLQEDWLFQLAQAMEGLPAYCVGVYCSIEELERRELTRGDRGVGYARSQLEVSHTHAPYDVHVHTDIETGDASVAAIAAMLESPPEVTFFERIRGLQEYHRWSKIEGRL